MLLNLHLKNYALIEDLSLEFDAGFNILTGETGAGKSIIIDSLNLILGERASSDLIRKGSDRCFVTAEFDCGKLKKVKESLKYYSISDNDDGIMMIRREIDIKGKSRAFINDIPVTLNTLDIIGEHLVDLHGQHEHQGLIHTSHQRELLDSFGKLESIKTEVFEKYEKWQRLCEDKKSQSISEQEKERLIDLYTFQVNEIENTSLKIGEDGEIQALLPRLKNSGKLIEYASEVHELLYSKDGSVSENIQKALKAIEAINSLCGALESSEESLKSASISVEDVVCDLEKFKDNIDVDPGRLEEMLKREDDIKKLKKKYGSTIEEVLNYKDNISRKLESLLSMEKSAKDLDAKIEKAESELRIISSKLSKERKKTASILEKEIKKQLIDLGMKKAQFIISVTTEDLFTREGSDHIEFMFSANMGEDLKPLKKIGSGGEISRVMLSIKTVFAKEDDIDVLVFDEIDSGVGGPMGQVVGKKMKYLSKTRQVICITHLPQIAAFSDKHIHVYKATENNRTKTRIEVLNATRHEEEVARMLSGEKVTQSARSHASELIKEAVK